MDTIGKNLVHQDQHLTSEFHTENEVIMSTATSTLNILELPESITLHIFSFLPFSSIGAAAQVCSLWNRISQDELLWRHVFLQHYKLPVSAVIPAKASSWRSEFKRLYYHTPAVLVEEKKEHKDEVLHVSFSHDGTMFATCSKDGFFKVWEVAYPVRLLFKMDMKSSFSWKFTQFSQFNETDTCLLVSGVYFGRLSTSGEIAVFNLLDDFRMQCRVTNKPYDVFGAWYDNDHLLSGTLYWTGDFNSVSAVWLSKASQEVESEVESVSMVLYRFENVNSSSIRLLHVAEIDKDVDMVESIADRDDPVLSESAQTSSHSSCVGQEDISAHSAICSEVARSRPEVKQGQRSTPQERGCIFDQLLQKCIAEDEFDLENEDKTDDEGDGVEKMERMENMVVQNEVGMQRETDRLESVEMFDQDFSGTSGERNGWTVSNSSRPEVILQAGAQISADRSSAELECNVGTVDCRCYKKASSSDPTNTCLAFLKPNASSKDSDNAGLNVGKAGNKRQDSNSIPIDRTAKRKSIDQCQCVHKPPQRVSGTSCEGDHLCENKASVGSNKDRTFQSQTHQKKSFSDEALSISNQSNSLSVHTPYTSTSLSAHSFTSEQNVGPMIPQPSHSHDLQTGSSVHLLDPKERSASQPSSSSKPSRLALLDFLATDTTGVSNDNENLNPSILAGTDLENKSFALEGRTQETSMSDLSMTSVSEDLASLQHCGGANQVYNKSTGHDISEAVMIEVDSDSNAVVANSQNELSPDTVSEYVDSFAGSQDGHSQYGEDAWSSAQYDMPDGCQLFEAHTSPNVSPHNVPFLFDNNPVMLIPGVCCDSHCHRDNSEFLNSSGSCNDNNNNMSNRNPNSGSISDNGLNLDAEWMNHNALKSEACSSSSLKNSIATQTDTATSRASSFHSLSHASHSSSLSRDLHCSPPREKLLIYTWGSETYIPHKIGIKRMKCTDFSKGEVTARRSSMLLPDVMENLHNMAGNRRDKPDVTIEMHGHIVGLSLSPDHKFLYVNCRPWPNNYIISDPQESPPLAQEVEISTIDLSTFNFVGPVLRSHKAYTHSDECFFLNLDVSDDYVASGAEDCQGYLWDRHYGIPLYRFPHRKVVNCVAINPQDPETLVTVSDDFTFKVWMSRCRANEVTGATKDSAIGTRV